MVRHSFLLIYLIIISCILVACVPLERPEDLTQKPVGDLREEDLHAIVSAHLKGRALTFPIEGVSKSIQKIDLDGDNKEELVVFFVENENNYGVMVLKEVAGKWEKVLHNLITYSNGINFVYFIDVTGDNKPEIIIGWQNDSYMQPLRIFTWEAGEIKQILDTFYADLQVVDIDDDGLKEVVLIKGDFYPSGVFNLKVFKYDDNNFKIIDSVETGENSYLDKIIIGKVNNREKGIFINYGLGAHSGYIDLFIWKKGRLVPAFTNAVESTLQIYPRQPEDINNDGIIEIPLLKKPVGAEDLALVEVPWITQYYQWIEKNHMKLMEEFYEDYQKRYRFNFIQLWIERVTIRKILDTHGNQKGISFNLIEDGKIGKPLLEIRHFTPEEWLEQKEKYKFLAENNNCILGGIIFKTGTSLDINEKILEKNFSFIQSIR